MAELNFTYKDQCIVLASWAYGQHRKDIQYLKKDAFKQNNNEEILKAYDLIAIQNVPFGDLNAKGLDIATIVDFATYYEFADIEYSRARNNALNVEIENIRLNLANAEVIDALSVNKACSKIQTLQKVIEGKSTIERAKNLDEIFDNEIDFRKNEKSAKYGIADIDKVTGGIFRKQLTALVARPSEGKSALALQIADNVRLQGHKVLFLPLEMTTEEMLERLLIRNQIINGNGAKTGNLEEDQRSEARQYLKDLEEQDKLYFYEGLSALEDIISLIDQENPYLVVIDQLNQIRFEGRFKDERERVKFISRELKSVAQRNNTAILLLHQHNREASKNGGSLETISEADAIGQDADNAFSLEVDKNRPQNEEKRPMKLVIMKQRQGPRYVEVPLVFIGEGYKFSNVLQEETTDDNNIPEY